MSSKTDPRAFRNREAQVPGEEERALAFVTDEPELDARDSEIASLRAQLAHANRLAGINTTSSVVYEYETPHGKQAREASAFGHLTVADLMARIDAGEAREPMTSVLCADGWYARRGNS